MALLAVLAAGLIALLLWERQGIIAAVQATLQGLDPIVAAALFCLTSVIGIVVLFPTSLLMLLGGVLFGFRLGLLLNLISYCLGITVAFILARSQFKPWVLRLLPAQLERWLQGQQLTSWQAVATMRLIGIIPGMLLNYAFGLTTIARTTFIWASVLFTTPHLLILTYAGVAGDSFIESGDMRNLLWAVVLLGVLSVGTFWLRKRSQRKQADSPPPP